MEIDKTTKNNSTAYLETKHLPPPSQEAYERTKNTVNLILEDLNRNNEFDRNELVEKVE